jgi:uncharacterized membrane protein YeaQ/YmgE (transglycosylase-associated protein family)
MNFLGLIISLVSGAVGGNLAGAVMKDKSLGTVGNSLAGILGGGLGGFILNLLGFAGGDAAASSLSLPQIISNIAGGGIGGAILLAVISLFRGAARKA